MSSLKKKKLFFLWLSVILILLPAFTYASIENASLIESEALVSLFWDTSAKAYGEPISGLNSDAKIRVCADSIANASSELGSKGATLVYAVGTTSGNTNSASIALNQVSSGDFESFTAASSGDTKCRDSNVNIQISRAYYPGRIFVVIDKNSDGLIDAGDTFIPTEKLDFGDYRQFQLPGSFSYGTKSYAQGSGLVSVNINGVQVLTDSGLQSMTGAGTSLDYVMIGFCNDEDGEDCTDTDVTNLDAGTLTLDSLIVSPSDTVKYDKFIVSNGISEDFCIGPDLRITNIDTNGPVYAGQETTIDITIQNNGNVDVNTDFGISLNQTDANAVETIVLSTEFSQIAYDDFETDFGHWDNNANFSNNGTCFIEEAWGQIVNSTPSGSTGPQSGGVGGAGTNFIYVETSKPATANGCYHDGDQALVYFSESIDHDLFDGRIEFYFYAYGGDIDSLYLEENSTGSWVKIWEHLDTSFNNWNHVSVDLSSLSGVGSLRFNYTRTSDGYYSDIALDQINVSVRGSNITTNLPPSSSTTISVDVTPDTGTGSYEYDAEIILDSIADCNEGNNADLGTLTVENVYSVIINIDGQETVHFDEAARPHNFSIQIVDADGLQPPNITVIVSETNGLNIMAPLQWYEGDTRSLGSISQARFLTNDTGYAAVSLIPTSDKVYTNLIDSGKDNSFIGNYSLTLELFDQDGNQLPVLYDGVIYQSLPMYVDDNSYPDVSFGGPPEATDTFNNNVYLELSRDYLQRVWGWMNKYLAVS